MSKSHRIAIVGDTFGIKTLLKYMPIGNIACFIVASIRPQYIAELQLVANRYNKPCLIQPKFDSTEYPKFLADFKQLKISLLICNSYSMILRQDLLESISYNAVNLHGSLLPKNRGPNPIQWSIIKGEAYTGVTLHFIDKNIDSGDIIVQCKILIDEQDTWFSLSEKIYQVGSKLLENELPRLLAGNYVRIPQDHKCSTYNSRLTPDSPKIEFHTMDDRQIYNLIRAQVYPLKGAYICHEGKRIVFDKFVPYNKIADLRAMYANKIK